MVEETQGPGDEESGPPQEAPRPASRRARPAQPEPAPQWVEPPRSGGLPPHIASALVSAIVLVLLAPGLFVAGYFTNAAVDDDGGGGGTVVANPTTPPATAVPQPTARPVVNADPDDDPFWGPEDAKVTIIEFSDYQ